MPTMPRVGARPRAAKRSRVRIAAVLAVCAAALLVWALWPADEGTYGDYRTFAEQVEAGQVVSVTLDGTRVWYELADPDPALGALYTDNPQSPDFVERLLLQGVQVGYAADADEVFSDVLDLLFYALFFGVAIVGIYQVVKHGRSTFKVVRRTGVTFDDVAGLGELKRELRATVAVLKDPGAYAARGIRPVKGIVLEGPPGNGKTLVAKALAQEAGVSFIATKGADFQSAFMSLGARKIRMLFGKAARHTPCIVFIDEFDSIGERRNYAGTGIDKENNRIITAMLNEMDGFADRSGILVVAATNSYRSLDPALVRPGRFDLKFHVGDPDAAARRELVALYTAGKTLAPDVTAEKLVAATDGLSCAAIEACLNGAASLAELQGVSAVTWDLVCAAARRADVRLQGE